MLGITSIRKMGGVIFLSEVTIATIADIHFGAMNPKRLYDELQLFLEEIENVPKIDLVVVAGDLFNNRLSVNGDHAKYCIKFCADLFKIAMNKSSKVIFLKGTESHDNDQLSMLYSMKNMTECDFEIIETVTDKEILPNLNVLFIPEEYMENKDEYYKDYFDKKYDFIFGHGLVDKALFIASIQESEFTRPNAPIFSADLLSDITHGSVYFGHVHKGMDYRKFRYVSSFSRWAFGESEAKGFYITTYDTDTKEIVKEKFIENILAPRYDTVKIFDDSSLFKDRPHVLVQNLLKFSEDHTRDNLRIEIHIPGDYEEPNLLVSLLNETFKQSRVKLKIVNTLKAKVQEKAKEKIHELMTKYKIIFDRKADVPSKLSEYIRLNTGRNIPLDKIKSYLHMDIC